MLVRLTGNVNSFHAEDGSSGGGEGSAPVQAAEREMRGNDSPGANIFRLHLRLMITPG